MTLSLPHDIANGNSADGDELGANFAAIEAAINNDVLLRAGGTMAGSLVLAADPDADMKAATKQYVDRQVLTSEFERTTDVALSTSGSIGNAITFENSTNGDPYGLALPTADVPVPTIGVYLVCCEWDLNKIPGGSSSDYSFTTRFFVNGEEHVAVTPGSLRARNLAAFQYTFGFPTYLRAGDTIQLRYLLEANTGTQSITIQNAKLHLTRFPL